MTETALKWLKAAPLPVLILSLAAYTYSVDAAATTAAKDAAVAIEARREQARRLERIEEKLDALTEAVAHLNLATTVRLNALEAKKEKK